MRSVIRRAAIAGGLLGLVLGAVPEAAADDAALERARELVARYVALAGAFDPALADLYSDAATIRSTRHYPSGQTRSVELSGTKQKNVLRNSLPIAKKRGVAVTFEDITYAVEGNRVRVRALRRTGSADPERMSWLVGPVDGRGWRILEEQSETRL